MFAERAILRFTDISVEATTAASATSASAVFALFLLVAPMEEAAKVLVVSADGLTHRLDGPRLGVVFGVSCRMRLCGCRIRSVHRE